MTEFQLLISPSVKPIAEYARSAVHFSRYQLYHGGEELEMGMELMEKVAGSNSEDADQAADILKKIKTELMSGSRRPTGEVNPTRDAAGD